MVLDDTKMTSLTFSMCLVLVVCLLHKEFPSPKTWHQTRWEEIGEVSCLVFFSHQTNVKLKVWWQCRNYVTALTDINRVFLEIHTRSRWLPSRFVNCDLLFDKRNDDGFQEIRFGVVQEWVFATAASLFIYIIRDIYIYTSFCRYIFSVAKMFFRKNTPIWKCVVVYWGHQ